MFCTYNSFKYNTKQYNYCGPTFRAVLTEDPVIVPDIWFYIQDFLGDSVSIDDDISLTFSTTLLDSLSIQDICSFAISIVRNESLDIQDVAAVIVQVALALRTYFVLDMHEEDCRNYFSMQLFKSIFDYSMN